MKLLLPILVLILSLASVAALTDTDIKVTILKDNIYQNESAEFLVSVNNIETIIHTLKIYSPDVEWIIPTEDIKAYPQKETDNELLITPTKYVAPGMYGVNINFKDINTQDIFRKVLYINVKQPGQAFSNYVPSITIQSNIEKTVKPGSAVLMTMIIENQNLLVLEDLTLSITSDLELFNTEQQIALKSLEKKALELNYNVNPLEAPGNYKIRYELKQGNQVVAQGAPIEVIVPAMKPDYLEESKIEKGIFGLRTTNSITYTSQSNVDDSKTIKIKAGFIKRMFTDTSISSKTITEDGEKYIAFDLPLSPGESMLVIVETSYWPVVYILLIAIIIGIVYLIYRSPIAVKKSVSDVQLKEGGISEISVVLNVKNTSSKAIKDLSVADYLPHIVSVSNQIVEGTLKPTAVISRPKKSTIIKWEIPELASGEERIISYTLKSKLSVFGNFILPRAKVVFKEKNREFYSYSNTVGVNT
jgi:hypothetical protein